MKIKIKKLSKNSIIPSYAQKGDAGMDLMATSVNHDEHGNIVYGTGLAIEIPTGYVGLLFPRSSNTKKDLCLLNSVGVIDSGYRGEITFKYRKQQPFFSNDDEDIKIVKTYSHGDRVGQLIIMPYPAIEFEEVEELSDSERGIGGYGSTGD